MSEIKIPKSLIWLSDSDVKEKGEEISLIYKELYKKLYGVNDFAKRLSYVTDALEKIFCLVNNENYRLIGNNKSVNNKKFYKKTKKWKRNKLR